MPLDIRILPAKGLFILTCCGRLTLAESLVAMTDYAAHPDFARGQRQLVDLAGVTDWERNWPGVMELQARNADIVHDPARPTMVVVHAPTEPARRLANLVARSWDDAPGARYLVVSDEAEALALLGLREPDFASLRAGA